eukprot:m.86221 g.86221  ORF g.86221 m.86221 type:complete len:207 (-) comp8755_c0_seq11:255-875(-)
MYRSFLAGLTMYVEFYFIYSAIYILLFFPTAFLNISLRLSYLCRQCVLQPFSMFPLQMTLVSLSDEGEETISSLSHSTKAVTTACGPMEALHAGRYKDLPSITYEMEQWSRVCRGMLSDLKEAKSEGTDLAQVFARNKEVTDVTVRQCYCHMKSSTQNKNNFFVYHACFFFLFSLIVMSNLFVSKRRIGMLMRDFGLQVWMKLATS